MHSQPSWSSAADALEAAGPPPSEVKVLVVACCMSAWTSWSMSWLKYLLHSSLPKMWYMLLKDTVPMPSVICTGKSMTLVHKYLATCSLLVLSFQLKTKLLGTHKSSKSSTSLMIWLCLRVHFRKGVMLVSNKFLIVATSSGV